MRRLRFLVLCSALLLVAFPTVARSQWLNGTLNGSAQVGWRAFTKDLNALQRAKFDEYKATPSGLLLEQLSISYAGADSFSVIETRAHNVGLADQTVALRGNRPGRFDLQFRWDRIPHVFSTNARSLGSQPTPDVFVLPNPRPDTTAWNRTSPYLAPVRLHWDAERVSTAYTPSEHWDFKAEYTRMGKNGTRPIGMAMGSPGSNLREILEPIDQDVHDVRLTQAYSSARFQLLASYDLSLFHNAYTSVTSDNPLVIIDSPTGGSSRGRTALAPDNLAHSAALNGAVSLPMHTHINASLTHAWWRQNASFIPATINSAIVDPRIATLPTSLNGAAGTSSMTLSATSRPSPPFTISAKYRSFSYRDDTALDSVPLLIVNDRSISPAAERERFPFNRRIADVSVSWRAGAAPLTVIAGYGYDYWARNRETRNVYRTSEDAPRVSVDFTALDWLSVRTTYTAAWRKALDPYVQNSPDDLPEHRRFDQADRNRTRLNFLATMTPTDALSFSATWAIGRDAYPASEYGLQRDRSTMAGGDVAWTPSQRITLAAGYTREWFLTGLRSRYRATGQLSNLSYDWVAETRDVITTENASATIAVVPNRVEAGGRIDISSARYRMATYNPTTPTGGTAAQNFAATASDLPLITQKLQPMSLFVSYRYSSDWAATVRYQTETYDQNDFRTLGLLPAEGNGIFLGNDFLPYNAHFITLSVTYRVQSRNTPRSAL